MFDVRGPETQRFGNGLDLERASTVTDLLPLGMLLMKSRVPIHLDLTHTLQV